MMLHQLIRKKYLTVIGLNSGTSADGLDLAAVRVSLKQNRPTIKFIMGKTVAYPTRLGREVSKIVTGGDISIDEMIGLDRKLGNFYGEQAMKFGIILRRKNIKPDIIASHGQTVRHLPGQVKIGGKKQSGTLQLGHPETIAEKTSLVTVADFRQADIACGGEGSPITVFAMSCLLADHKRDRMIINIGGIANYFLFPKNKDANKIKAADCGPGNSLIDILARRLFDKKYDISGRLASKGKVSFRLLSLLSADNYLRGKYGPSTGRERFGEELADKIIKLSSKLGLSKVDVMATTTELSALAISGKVLPLIHKYNLNNVYLFGGGRKNRYLVGRLKENLEKIDTFSVDKLGYDPDYLEAICYAVMGAMAIGSKPSGLPRITGATVNTIAGRIVQPTQERYRQ